MADGILEVVERLKTLCAAQGLPSAAQFELTARCNLGCKMCYVVKKSWDKEAEASELTAAQWIRLARECRDAGVLTLNITGGEPLLRKDFWEIYDAICGMGMLFSINTNGTTITKEIAKRLAKTPPARVLVSIYGASPETYEKVTGSALAFEQARRGVELLLAAGLKVALRTTLIKENYKDYPLMNQWSSRLNVSLSIVDYVAPRREGLDSDPLAVRLDSEEIKEMLHIVQNSLRIEYDLRHKGDDRSAENAPRPPKRKKTEADIALVCGAGMEKFFITWDGKMTPCGLMSEPSANPLALGLLDAFRQLREKCPLVPKSPECESCDKKESCGYCPAKLKLETGHFDRKAQYLCDYPRRADL